MTDLEKIAYTSLITISGGVFVFTLGQIISKFFIEPVNNLLICIGETADTLIFSANIYGNPGTCKDEDNLATQVALRQRASQLLAKSNVVKLTDFSLFLVLPPQRNLYLRLLKI